MIPADLLNALREKDPELWGKIDTGTKMLMWWDRKQDGSIVCQHLCYNVMDAPIQEAWLQHCLQEAILARVGWGYQITAFGLPIIACVYNRRDYITARGESEAEALGWAYLAVIEGTCQSAAGLAG